MIKRKAEARWEGELKTGKGNIKLGSGAFEGPYSFGTRFEGAPGTNPEEMLGGAHAACFSMALSLALTQAGHAPKSVATTATVQLDQTGAGFSITGIALDTKVELKGLPGAEFQRFAEEAKNNCIVSRALSSVPMTLKAALA